MFEFLKPLLPSEIVLKFCTSQTGDALASQQQYYTHANSRNGYAIKRLLARFVRLSCERDSPWTQCIRIFALAIHESSAFFFLHHFFPGEDKLAVFCMRSRFVASASSADRVSGKMSHCSVLPKPNHSVLHEIPRRVCLLTHTLTLTLQTTVASTHWQSNEETFSNALLESNLFFSVSCCWMLPGFWHSFNLVGSFAYPA